MNNKQQTVARVKSNLLWSRLKKNQMYFQNKFFSHNVDETVGKYRRK